jgi:membrane protease YdiL (CAAX protease family)
VSINETPFPTTPPIDLASTSGGAETPADPDNPPWGLLQALFIWAASVVLLALVPLLVALPYLMYRASVSGGPIAPEQLLADKNFIFVSLLGVLPAHAASFFLVWFVVTRAGRRPFWRNLGWSWPEHINPRRGLMMSAGLAVLLLVIGIVITQLFGGGETQLDQLINSSYRARVATAFLAVVTGPLVEEIIYRGMLYSALQRAIGMLWAVLVVSTLFAAVHVYQYYNNFGVIFVISILSVSLTLVRARTRRLLPSYVMHLTFNGIQALILIFQPWLERFSHKTTSGFLLHTLQIFQG